MNPLPPSQKATRQVLLRFSADHPHMKDTRTEMSSCVKVGQYLFLSHDEGTGIERLKWTEEGFMHHKHFDLREIFDLPAGKGEMDLEALAYEAPYLWFTGSMSLKRDKPDPEDSLEEQLEDLSEIDVDENRFILGCVPCVEVDGQYELVLEATFENEVYIAKQLRGGPRSSELQLALMKDPHLAHFMHIPSKDNGFDIEGLAVHEGRIFVGLRGPVLRGWAVILEIKVAALGDTLVMMPRMDEPYLYRKHFLKLGGKGVRELRISPRGDLLILAGPTMALDGEMSLYRVERGLPDQYASVHHVVERVFDLVKALEAGPGEDQAEGLAFLSEKELLVIYDGPMKQRLVEDNAVWGDVFELA